MTAKRIFIAIDISDKAREAVARYIDNLRVEFRRASISWEQPEKLHFTIRFLGEIDDAQSARVIDIADAAARVHEPFAVRIVNTGVFPHPKDPKVLWLGVKRGEHEMTRINSEIESALGAAGFPAERRRFHPHLTIGRVRDPLRSRELIRVHRQRQFEPIVFTITGITVYESNLLRSGSLYSPLQRFQFLL